MLESLIGGNPTLQRNIRFLSQFDLGKIFHHLMDADEQQEGREEHDMQITQQQLDDMTAKDAALGEAVSLALSRSQAAQQAAQQAQSQLAGVQEQLATAQQQITQDGEKVDLSKILTDLDAAAQTVGTIDVTLSPSTGTAAAATPGDAPTSVGAA